MGKISEIEIQKSDTSDCSHYACGVLQKEKILKTVGGDRFSPNHYKMVEKGSEMKLKKIKFFPTVLGQFVTYLKRL